MSRHRCSWLLLLLWSTLSFASARVAPLPGRAVRIADITYKATPQGRLQLDLYRPDSADLAPHPVVVFIHGGSWQHGSRAWVDDTFKSTLLRRMLAAGYAVVSIDYRLINSKRDVHYPQPLADCKDAVRWVRREALRYGFDEHRIAVMGCSAGGHLALMTAYSPDSLCRGDAALGNYSSQVKCCVDVYGPTHLRKMFRAGISPVALGVARLVFPKSLLEERLLLLDGFCPGSAKRKDRIRACALYSPLTYTDTAVPTVIFHGNKDSMVPLKQSLMLRRDLLRKGQVAELHIVEGENHAFPTIREAQTEEMARQLLAFLGQFL